MEITLYYATLKRINSFCDFLLRDFITIQGSLTMVGLWCLTPLSTINFSYIVVVSFIGGGNRRKPSHYCIA
jgi:hypothetical protein